MAAPARRRLLRDLAEVQRNPSELVAALPLEDNLFEWHTNLRPSSGPLAGVVLHLRIVFPQDYPNSPPNMLFPFDKLPSFRHPNLYSFGLCLDILQSYVGMRVERAGWSSSYSVRTVLLQLQSFLFEFDAAPQDHGGSYSVDYTKERVALVRREAGQMSCQCGHCPTKQWPPLLLPAPEVPEPPRPKVLLPAGQLRQLRREIALTEAAVGPMKLRKSRHSAYLSAGDEPLVFRSAVASFGLRIVEIRSARRSQVLVRAGFSAELARRPAAFFAEGIVAWDLKKKGMEILRTEEKGACAVLVLRNVQVLVETEAYPFVQGAPPPVHLLPALREKEKDLVQQVQQVQQRRYALEEQRLQAQEADLSRPLREGAAKCPWALLTPGLLLQIFQHLDVVDTVVAGRACKVWWRLCTRYNVADRIELCCFHSKASAQEEVLGLGVTVAYHDDGNIKEVGTELDVLSAGAFYEGKLRKGAWGGNFSHFLPLMLDAVHARRALPTLRRALAAISLKLPGAQARDFQPWMALAVIPQVMNSFVVSLMREEDVFTDEVPRHSSERALLGYCSFHHMLLALRARHPEIGEVATERLRRFVQGHRSKAEAPDLGQLLVYMAVSEDVQWEDLAAAILDESHVRGVRWLLRERPGLENNVPMQDRLRWSFQGRATSSRLLLFQAFFLRHVARPAGESLTASLARYDRQFGQPTGPQKERLVRACREILQVRSWPQVFQGLGLPVPEDEALAGELCAAVQRSRELGYHGVPTLLQAGRSILPERVGIKKCMQRAFKEAKEAQAKQALAAPTARPKRAAQAPKRAVQVSRGGFAALASDSD